MAKRGPKRQPTNILKLRGSRRVEDRPKNEPVPVKGMPKPPEWLEGEGLAEWNRKALLLYEQGTLTLVDDMAFAGYCRTCQLVKEVNEALKTDKNLTVLRKNGSAARNPLIDMLDKAIERMRKLAAEFGMTPSGRTGINVPKLPIETETPAQKWVARNGA